MKKLALSLCILSCVVLLVGATNTPAPVLPTKDFYVNDYAGVLFGEHRTEISAIARTTYEDTGIQVVLLIADRLHDVPPEQYAESVVAKWNVEGSSGYGVLFLIDRQSEECYLYAGSGLSTSILTNQAFEQVKETIISPFFLTGNFSTGIRNGYREITRILYTGLGLEIYESLEKQPYGGISLWASLFFVVVLGCVIRSFYVTSKYKKKYLYRHTYKRRRFIKEQFEYDEDMAARSRGSSPVKTEESNIRRNGLIVYRDEETELD